MSEHHRVLLELAKRRLKLINGSELTLNDMKLLKDICRGYIEENSNHLDNHEIIDIRVCLLELETDIAQLMIEDILMKKPWSTNTNTI
jgi:hypothetical protein